MKSKLFFGAASLLLAATTVGCSGSSAIVPAGTWGETGDQKPVLVLSKDGGLSGTDGCNNLSGDWKLEGDKVTFGPVAMTLMACEGVDTWLSSLSSATISGDTMTVLNEAGATIGELARQK